MAAAQHQRCEVSPAHDFLLSGFDPDLVGDHLTISGEEQTSAPGNFAAQSKQYQKSSPGGRGDVVM